MVAVAEGFALMTLKLALVDQAAAVTVATLVVTVLMMVSQVKLELLILAVVAVEQEALKVDLQQAVQAK